MSTTSSAVGRGRRTSALDRSWLDHWTVLAILPIRSPDLLELRSDMMQFMESDPKHPMCCTLEEDGRRWRPVEPQHRRQYLEEVIVSAGAFPREDPFGYLVEHRPMAESTAPYKLMVGPDSVTCYFAHPLGDAAVFSPFTVLMALGDVEGLRPLRSDAGLATAGRILLKELPQHGRDWWKHLRSGSGAAPAGQGNADASPTMPANTEAAGVLVSAADVNRFKAWRKSTCPDVSTTALMASATYRTLSSQQIPLNGTGFYTLVDLRRHLPKRDALRPGNFAKSVYVPADMAKPAEVGAAMKQLIGSARAVPALFSGALSVARGHRSPGATHAGGPLTLTFNSMMHNPGIDHIPWIDPSKARYISMSYPVSMDGISVMACAVEGQLEFTASFNPGAVDRGRVQQALTALHDLPSLLAEPPREPAVVLNGKPVIAGGRNSVS
ncbi:MAG: hypothetical protein JO044_19615 [Mycobacteriaceae bacterium]|nr:hypothetical protein [Mycobacteriaceae bacterium]MBV9641834.1 hypothetical protein [Mycobacteriaceae bacterium]